MPRQETSFAVSCNRLSCYFGDDAPVDFHEPFALYAARLGRHVTPAEAALRRATEVHALCGRVRGGPPGLTSLAGFYVDCHIPAIRWAGTMQRLYVGGMAPEQSSDFPVACYPVGRFSDEVTKAWYSHDQLLPKDDLSIKLMRKGGPAPLSVRYVAGLLRRCAADGAPTQALVKEIILSHHLGAYKHSTRLVDPMRRVALYSRSTPDLSEEMCRTSTTKQVHAVLTEFVTANTLQHQALVKSIGHLPDSYIANPTKAKFGARTTHAHTTPVAFNVFGVMLKALNVHHTTLSTARTELGEDATGRILARGVSTDAFTVKRSALVAMGLTALEAQHIVRCFTERKCGTLKMMRQVLKQLSPRSRRVLGLYMWTCRQRLSVSVSYLHNRVKAMQLRAQRDAHAGRSTNLVVCLVCSSVKMGVHGMKTPKTRVGVSVNIDTDELACNSCGYSHIQFVNIVGRVLTVGCLQRARRSVVMCCACARVSAETRILGIYPLCPDCWSATSAKLKAPTTCLCGRDAASGAEWSLAKRGVDVVTFALCFVHRHMRLDGLVDADDLLREMAKSR